MFEIPEWPYYLGKPTSTGVMRSCPEDFLVEEITRVEPEGDGSHLWLWVEKRLANTDWVAKELAKAMNCPHRDVGYAGLKDRRAVTRQWFSVPYFGTAQQLPEHIEIEGVTILESRRHTRKLKRGALNGNHFTLNIRGFSGDSVYLAERLEQISVNGVPNYFGPQRFGHHGRNVEQGYRLLKKRARLQRNKRSIYLSALRSFLFNQVLAERVRAGTWNAMIGGELAMLDGTQSIFPCVKVDEDIEYRCKCLDIHPTGPMPGESGNQPTGEAMQLEESVLQHWAPLTCLLKDQRVQASRRALRLYPAGLEWQLKGSDLKLAFVLPPGAYATTVLREVFKEHQMSQYN